MTTTYDYNLEIDFSEGINIERLDEDINDNLVGLENINVYGDDVSITFSTALSDSDKIILDGIVASHLPDPARRIQQELFMESSDVLKFKDSFGKTIDVLGSQSMIITISKESQGQYSSIKEAVLANFFPNAIYTVYPGTYMEDNPITLPPGAILQSAGTPGNTVIQAINMMQDLLILNAWCRVNGMTIRMAMGPGARGIYFNGSLYGQGSYAGIQDCIVQNCDIGIEADSGPDTVLVHRTLVHPLIASTSKGLYVHSGGSMIVTSTRVTGIPMPYTPVNEAIVCQGVGSSISLTTSSAHFCTHGLCLDDNAEAEITLLTTYYCVNATVIGPTNTNTKIRASSFHLLESLAFDLMIHAQEADLTFFSCEMIEEKIYNPNKVKFNSKFYSFQDSKKFQTITGEIRMGSVKNPSITSFGEGRYDQFTTIVFSNNNLENGNWVDISTGARSSDNSTFQMFQGVGAGNCLYVGSDSNISGFKINVTSSTTIVHKKEDVSIEYWTGTEWSHLHSMQSEAKPPYYHNLNFIGSLQDKQHIRFNIKNSDDIPLKTINGQTKKWIRLRIINTLSSIPMAEYIKPHTNHSEIKKDGFIQFFGDARTVNTLNINQVHMLSSNDTQPGNQELFLAKNYSIKMLNNRFRDGVLNRICISCYLPFYIDTSFPLKIKFLYVCDSNTPGDVEFRISWTCTADGRPIWRNLIDAPDGNPDMLMNHTTIIPIPADSKDTDRRCELSIDIDELDPNPRSGVEHILWIFLERDARVANSNDTYPGSISIGALKALHMSWATGGHISEY